MLGGTVPFEVPREIAFDYLVDPRNRPEWQSSLARVEQVTGEPRAGQTWLDVTKVRVHPQMQTTAYERPLVWSESGVWHGVSADLTLRLDATVRGCLVRFRFRIRELGPVGVLASVLAVPTVRADLRRAARILSSASG
jgi:uncharacterized protein YndB with AHSA1/START domain